jgi:hypothetical protein
VRALYENQIEFNYLERSTPSRRVI